MLLNLASLGDNIEQHPISFQDIEVETVDADADCRPRRRHEGPTATNPHRQHQPGPPSVLRPYEYHESTYSQHDSEAVYATQLHRHTRQLQLAESSQAPSVPQNIVVRASHESAPPARHQTHLRDYCAIQQSRHQINYPRGTSINVPIVSIFDDTAGRSIRDSTHLVAHEVRDPDRCSSRYRDPSPMISCPQGGTIGQRETIEHRSRVDLARSGDDTLKVERKMEDEGCADEGVRDY